MAENDSIGTVAFGVEAHLGDTLDQFAAMRKSLDDLSRGVEKSSTESARSFKGLGDKIQSTGLRIGQSISNIGTAMTKYLTPIATGLIGVGSLAARSAIQFESSFAGVRKTIEATEAEFQALEQQFRSMSREIPITVKELNKIGETAGQLGIAKESIAAFTRTVADMANTTNLTADAAANAFARIGNIMGLTTADYQKLGSAIVDLGNKGSSTETEIVNMGLRIAGAARSAGITTPGMLGLAAALANVGVRAEAGGTAMSKLIMQMAGAVSEGGEKLDQFAHAAGLSASAFATAFKEDGANAIALFVQGLGRIQQSGGDLFAVLDEMGIKEIRLRDAILRSASANDMFSSTLVTSKAAWQENTALTEEAEKRYRTTASQLQVFQNKLDDITLTIGQAFIPIIISMLDAIKPIVETVAAWASAFAELDPTVQRSVVTILGLSAVAGPLILLIGSLVSAVSALGPVVASVSSALTALPAILTAVGASATALWALIAANPWVALATALAGAATAIILNWDKIKVATSAVWTTIKTTAINAAKAIHDGIVEWLINKTQAIASRLQSVAQSFAKPFEWLADHLVGHSVVPDMVDEIGRQMELLDVKMSAPARVAASSTGKVFEGLALTTQSAMNQVVSSINFSYGSAVQTVSQALARMTTETQNWGQIGIQVGQLFLGNMITTFAQLLTQWILTKTGMAAADTAHETAKTSIFSGGEAARLVIAKSTNALMGALMVASLASMSAMATAAFSMAFAVSQAVAAIAYGAAAIMAATPFGQPAAGALIAATTGFEVATGAALVAGTGLVQAALGTAITAGAIGGAAFGSGGIVTGPTLGMIGEAGSSEAIIPLNSQGAGFMADMLGLSGQQQQSQSITLELDGQTFRRWLLRGLPDDVRLRAGAIA